MEFKSSTLETVGQLASEINYEHRPARIDINPAFVGKTVKLTLNSEKVTVITGPMPSDATKSWALFIVDATIAHESVEKAQICTPSLSGIDPADMVNLTTGKEYKFQVTQSWGSGEKDENGENPTQYISLVYVDAPLTGTPKAAQVKAQTVA